MQFPGLLHQFYKDITIQVQKSHFDYNTKVNFEMPSYKYKNLRKVCLTFLNLLQRGRMSIFRHECIMLIT